MISNKKRCRSEPISYKYEFEYNSQRKRQRKQDKQTHKHHQRKLEADSESDSEYNDSNNHDDSYFGCDYGVSSVGNAIYFQTKVSQTSVSSLIDIINSKNKEFNDLKKDSSVLLIKPNPIYLYITSYGGCLFSGFRAVDAIKRSAIPIYTVIDGYAASAATLMSVVGEKRFITPSSYMLIHQLSSGSIGKYWEIKDEYSNCKQLMDKIYEIYTKNTNMNREELEGFLTHDLWWDANKCAEVELIDEVLDKMIYH